MCGSLASAPFHVTAILHLCYVHVKEGMIWHTCAAVDVRLTQLVILAMYMVHRGELAV